MFGCISGSPYVLALQSQGKSAGSAVALMGVPQLLAGSIVAPLTGVAGSYAAMPMATVIVVCNVGAVVCYLTLTRRRHAPTATDTVRM